MEEPYKYIDKVLIAIAMNSCSSERFCIKLMYSASECLQTNRAVAAMEAEMKKLQDTADLFEVNFPEYKQLSLCRSDIILVKAVWDMVIFVKVNTTLFVTIQEKGQINTTTFKVNWTEDSTPE